MTSLPQFLSIDDVLTLHAIAIEDQGGDSSLRDRGLLESALAMPRQQFGGAYLHETIPSMASAYAFHICKNHPFLDGNKRAAVAARLAFLSDNGWAFRATADEAEPVILDLASGKLDKTAFVEWAHEHMYEKPRMELRQFFHQLTWEQVYRMPQSVVAGQSEQEADATNMEAAKAIPLITWLGDAAASAAKDGNEKAYAYYNSMRILLIAIYRIAEDMGYEW